LWVPEQPKTIRENGQTQGLPLHMAYALSPLDIYIYISADLDIDHSLLDIGYLIFLIFRIR